jgi:hypothetical protein
MPMIPESLSTVPYAPTPQPAAPVDLLSHADDILSRRMADVSNQMAGLTARMNETKIQADAASHDPEMGMAMTDLKEKYANDPDPSTATVRFTADAMAYKDKLLASIPDDAVKFYVAKRFSLHMPVTYAEVAHTAIG